MQNYTLSKIILSTRKMALTNIGEKKEEKIIESALV